MNNCEQDNNSHIVVKPGLIYYVPSVLSLFAACIFYFGLSEAEPSDNKQQDLIILYGFPLAIIIIGILLFMYYHRKKVIVYNDGIIVKRFFGQKHYNWDDISNAVCEHELGMPIMVYNGEQKIFRIEKAYKGYSAIKEVLQNRELFKPLTGTKDV